jgi:hypothetical protein
MLCESAFGVGWWRPMGPVQPWLTGYASALRMAYGSRSRARRG